MTSKNSAAEWYARSLAGESYDMIAVSAGMSRSGIAGAIDRYRRKNGLPSKQRVAAAPRRPLPPIVRMQVTTEQDFVLPHPSAPLSFQEAAHRKTCLSWEGDILRGSVAFCHHPQERRGFCPEHYAKYFRPASRVSE